MAVNYKLYQCNREGKQKGLWYARASYNGTVDTAQLADIMQANCTVKRSDILAVIAELVEVMSTQLANSMRVKLDGFGSFKIGLTTAPADTAKAFTAANIKGMHVIFQPEASRQTGKKFYDRVLLKGVKVREANIYDVDKKAGATDSADVKAGANEGE